MLTDHDVATGLHSNIYRLCENGGSFIRVEEPEMKRRQTTLDSKHVRDPSKHP